MEAKELLASRLYAQLLTGCHNKVKTPSDVVQSMCAMQAQEYSMAKWAIGLRLPLCLAIDVEEAFQRGEILRTHVLRPTWHFVHPNDIRWLIKLTAPNVHAKNRYMYKKTELNTDILIKACNVIENALDDKPLARMELQQVLNDAGIKAQGHRLSYIMMYAELEGLITSGIRIGKQFTYTLMDAAAPNSPEYSHEEMLAMLARRYFSSRVPATVQDFAYWSGLSTKDAKLAAQGLDNGYHIEKIKEMDYIVSEEAMRYCIPNTADNDFAFLMPDYDEYGVSYKDRTGLISYPDEMAKESIYSHWLVVNGMIAGTWSILKKEGKPTIQLFQQLASMQDSIEIERAKLRYQQFWAE